MPLALAVKARSSSSICHLQVSGNWSPEAPSDCLEISVSANAAGLVSLGGIGEPPCLGFSLPWPESCQASSPLLPKKCGKMRKARRSGRGVAETQPAPGFSGCRVTWPAHTGRALIILGEKKHPSKSRSGGRAAQEHFPNLLCLGIKSLLGNTSDGIKYYKWYTPEGTQSPLDVAPGKHLISLTVVFFYNQT